MEDWRANKALQNNEENIVETKKNQKQNDEENIAETQNNRTRNEHIEIKHCRIVQTKQKR